MSTFVTKRLKLIIKHMPQLVYILTFKKKTLVLDLHMFPTEAVTRRCSVKKVFLEILQNSHENTCARVSF